MPRDVSICKQFLIGLPETGKTTFIAALWGVVTSESVEGALQLSRVHGDHSYLEEICGPWSNASSISRTVVGREEFPSILLKSDEGIETELLLSDMSGEAFRSQWTDRIASRSYIDLLGSAAGGMLFIHPEQVDEDNFIVEADALAEALNEEPQPLASEHEDNGDITEDRVGDKVEEWSSKKAPTAMQIVDLLQIAVKHFSSYPKKLAVIISAWDIVSPITEFPDNYVQERLPLLHQYLSSNSEIFTVRYYGISAQGGSINTMEEADKLREKEPTSRIEVVTKGDQISNDITLPVRWIMT